MDWIGVILSFVYLFLVLLLSELIRKLFKAKRSLTRELVHIGVSFWGIATYYFFKNYLIVAIPPLVFTLINFISYKYDIFKAMELKGKIGTILYPISLVILFPFFWYQGSKIPAIAGLLIMGLGDGFAGLMGSRFGKHKYKIFSERSIEGSIFMFIGSCIAVLVVLMLYTNINIVPILLITLLTSTIATIVEAITPSNYDNITVPIISAFTFWGIFIWLTL